MEIIKPKIIVSSFNTWHMDHSAIAYQKKNALAGIYSSINNSKGINSNLFHRCYPFHICMKPFYHFLPPLEWQQVQYRYFMSIYDRWFKMQILPKFNIIQAIAWGAKAPFDVAEKLGALKVLDAPNSYPTTYDSYERREMAIWGKSVRPSVPEHIIEQVVRDIERADIILCPSKWVYDSMLANGVPAEKCQINYFGVNANIFTPRKEIPNIPRFICIGNICLRKGHQYLFPAFEKIKQEYPNAELYCLGSVLSDFKHLWKKWKGLINFQGNMSQVNLSQLLNKCTAFILPSIEEGFARAIIEAMSGGLPILTTYESGATTLISNMVEGIIFPSRNILAIYDSMKLIIENPQIAQKMGLEAERKGREKNSWQDYGERNLKIFENFLNNKIS